MISKPEMNRRIASIAPGVANKAYKDVLDGFGASGLVNSNPITLKQANALFAWRERYGGIYPVQAELDRVQR
jgi:hypothetical protein